jgi:uncharacterized protein (DUF1330 family)
MSSNSENENPSFFVAEVVIHDPDGFKAYAEQFENRLSEFGGRLLSFGASINPVEGHEDNGARAAIVVFPTAKAGEDWFASPTYRKIAPIREKSASTRAFSVAGLPNAGK